MRSRKTVRPLSRRKYVMFFAPFLLVILVVVAMMYYDHQVQVEFCTQQLQLHAVRFRVINNYRYPIQLDWKYSDPVLFDEQYDVDGLSRLTIYTTTRFPSSGYNVNLTFTVYNVTEGHRGPQIPYPLPTIRLEDMTLVYDANYQARFTQYATTTLNLECVTNYVWTTTPDETTLTFGP